MVKTVNFGKMIKINGNIQSTLTIIFLKKKKGKIFTLTIKYANIQLKKAVSYTAGRKKQ